MESQTRALGRGLGEKIVDSGSLADPQNTEISPAQQAPPKRRSPYAEAAIETLLVLRERFPATFARLNARARPPLKIGIRDELFAALPEIDAIEIARALRFYVCGAAYVKSCVEGAQRIGLDGQVAGVVAADEARWPPKPNPPQAAPTAAPTPPPPSRLTLAGLREAAAKRKLAANGG
jgi:ProQ/FINO family